MKKFIIAALFLASTTVFAQEQPKCDGKVYDPAVYECTGNLLVEVGKSAVEEEKGMIDSAIDAVTGTANTVWKKVKFW